MGKPDETLSTNSPSSLMTGTMEPQCHISHSKRQLFSLLWRFKNPAKNQRRKNIRNVSKNAWSIGKNGEIEYLMREGKAIENAKRHDAPNKAKVFAKLVMKGQINSALRFLSEDGGRGVVPLTDDVMTQLNKKHPTAKKAKLGSLLFGPVEDVPAIIYQEIDGEMIKEAALRTIGSGGLLVLMRMDLRDFWPLNRSRNRAQILVMLSPL